MPIKQKIIHRSIHFFDKSKLRKAHDKNSIVNYLIKYCDLSISRLIQDFIIIIIQFTISLYFLYSQEMKKDISVKEGEKGFQTSLTNYLNSKIIKKSIATQTKQVKEQPKIDKQEQDHRHVQNELRIIITQQNKSLSNRSPKDQQSSISARSSSPQPIIQKKEPTKNVNVLFYLNKMPSQPYGEYIEKMHEAWFKDYEKLERDHSFIQWIFPNSFQSRFNMHARPLSSDEAEEFRTNPQIIERYLKSYDMMLAFYGLKLKDKYTGELVRSRNPDFKQRMHKTLLTSFHNHMRITRICCSLNQTGFGRYATELCKILKFEIYDKQGFMNSLQRYNVYKDWKPFEIHDERKGLKNVYLQKINKKKELNNLMNKCNEQIQKQKQQKPQVLKQKEEYSIMKVLRDKKQND